MNAAELTLDSQSTEPLNEQLYRHLRSRMLDGRLPGGTRLPSTRRLAEQLAIGRTTVVAAYRQLALEGYVAARSGAGTFVVDGLTAASTAAATAPPPLTPWGRRVAAGATPERNAATRPEFDFGFGRAFPHIFPYTIWRRLLARYLSTDDVMLARYGSAAGFGPLREALAHYLQRSRDVDCTADQVVIVSGAQQALDLLARLLLHSGDPVLVETPGYSDAYALLQAHGARLTPLPVDDQGFPVESIPGGSEARLVFVTPANQFPRGGTMPVRRRLALLDWAAANGAFIIEDDYDSELRYDGRPVAALQGLDKKARVVYLGTFSKVLFPALRLGYVVLPRALQAPFARAKGLVDRGAPTLTQAAVTDFIVEGHFERHLRRLRETYGARRQTLVAALDRYLGDRLRYVDEAAGLHIMGYLDPALDETTVVAAARAAGIGLSPGAPYHQTANPRPSILLGFSGLDSEAITTGIERLATVIEELTAERREVRANKTVSS